MTSIRQPRRIFAIITKKDPAQLTQTLLFHKLNMITEIEVFKDNPSITTRNCFNAGRNSLASSNPRWSHPLDVHRLLGVAKLLILLQASGPGSDITPELNFALNRGAIFIFVVFYFYTNLQKISIYLETAFHVT